jgi:hypothetical protein
VVINAAATTNAGGPYAICSSDANVTLVGTYGGGATGGTWSGGAGTFGTPSVNTTAKTVTVTYAPTTTEKNAGTVNVTFTTTGQTAPCGADAKTVAVTINAAPSAPAVTYIPPACLETTFKLSVDNPHNGSTYTLRQLSGGVSILTKKAPDDVVGGKIVFEGLTVGKGYRVTETTNSGCISLPNFCGDFSSIVGQARIQAATTTPIVDQQPLKVVAYPNPFNEKINFVVTSPVSGKGSLDVYNSLGQKIKTVYQGNINKGSQNFELRLSQHQVSNLVYVLRVGDQQLTGKILQVNQ